MVSNVRLRIGAKVRHPVHGVGRIAWHARYAGERDGLKTAAYIASQVTHYGDRWYEIAPLDIAAINAELAASRDKVERWRQLARLQDQAIQAAGPSCGWASGCRQKVS